MAKKCFARARECHNWKVARWSRVGCENGLLQFSEIGRAGVAGRVFCGARQNGLNGHDGFNGHDGGRYGVDGR